MPSKIQMRELVDSLCATLDCSKRVLSRLLGLDPHTLANNDIKPMEDLTPRTRQRLRALYLVVMEDLCLLRPTLIYEILQMQVFPDLRGRKDSVVSALQQDKYEAETLKEIARLALRHAQEKFQHEHPRLSHVKTLSA